MRLRNILNLILISGCLLIAGVSLSLMAPFYPSEALAKGVSVTQSGIVMGSVFVATILFTPICGKYIDLLGARRFLLCGAILCAVGNIIFGFLDKINGTDIFFGLSILIRVFIALGEAAMTPASYTLAAQQVDEKDQGKAISLAEAAFGIGTMFGPSLGGALYDFGGFPVPFWVCGSVLLGVALLSVLCLEDKSDSGSGDDEDRGVGWGEMICAPNVFLSVFALAFAGSAWSWYSASLDPFLSQTFGLSSSETGFVFTAFGATYTVFTPIFGILSDKGMDGILSILIGNFLIGFGFLFMGPIPGFEAISGNLWLTIVSISMQGLGSAATYLGSLLLMMKGVRDAGLPETEQTKSMVSSLWIVADSFGGIAGSFLGSITYDNLGFKYSTLVESIAVLSTVLVIAIVYCTKPVLCRAKEDDLEERPLVPDADRTKQHLRTEWETDTRTYGSK